MIRNPDEILRSKRAHEREHPLTLKEKYDLLEAMYQEVRQLNRLKRIRAKDRKHKIALARMLNAGV